MGFNPSKLTWESSEKKNSTINREKKCTKAFHGIELHLNWNILVIDHEL